jgi:hypothetical protein
MMVVVTVDNVSDQQVARLIFERIRAIPERLRHLTLIWVDGTYKGIDFANWVKSSYFWVFKLSSAPMMLRDSLITKKIGCGKNLRLAQLVLLVSKRL